MADKLKAYLGLGSKAESRMGYHEAQGYLFAIACAPRVVDPLDWANSILGKRYVSLDPHEAKVIGDELYALFTAIFTAAARMDPIVPALDPAPMNNFDEQAPVAQWAQGFCAGHALLQADWLEALPLAEDPSFNALIARALPRLVFFASRSGANVVIAGTEFSVEEFAGHARALFRDGMMTYTLVGLHMRIERNKRVAAAPPAILAPKLKAFLGLGKEGEKRLGYHAAQGFLFAVACAPTAIAPAVWTLSILDDRSEQLPAHERDAIAAELHELFTWTFRAAVRFKPTLPPDCQLNPDPMANFDEASPIKDWARGFAAANTWLQPVWTKALPVGVNPRFDEMLATAVSRLVCFLSREASETFAAGGNVSLETFARDSHSFFVDAMTAYATVGLTRRTEVRSTPPQPPFPSPEKLKTYLGLYTAENGAMGYYSVLGFIFAIACAPKTVPLGTWMAHALGKRVLSIPRSEKLELMEELQMLWEATLIQSGAGLAALPPDCPLSSDPLTNFDESVPAQQWSRGFSKGLGLVEFDWRMAVRPDVSPAAGNLLGISLARLTCFSSRQQAEALVEVGGGSVEELAIDAHAEFESAMQGYARVGLERRMRSEGIIPPPPNHRVGRNDPCPCGSGKKYKKCCLVVH